MKLRLAALCAPLVVAAAMTLPTVFVVGASTATVTGYRFPAPPVASAGSLGPGQSVSFKLTVVSGTSPDPGGDVYLYQQHTHATGDVTSVPGAQCGGVTQLSGNASSPTHCVADSGGQVAMTYTASQQPPAVGGARWVAENAPTRPTVTANTHYTYCTIYRFSSSPIAGSGSLGSGASVPVTVTAKEGLDNPVASSPMYLSLRAASGGGSASVGSTTLTSTPKLFTADSGGAIQMTYTAPLVPPLTGQDTIVVQDNASVPTEVNSDMYAFRAATPAISAGDVTMTEGDQSPGVPAKFTITVSPVQPTAVTVQYTTLCGVGDQGCEGIIPDDFNAVLTPVTVTIPANASSTTINVEQFSYTGGHGGESYNEGWFVKLENPSGAVLGRSVGEGLLQPDVESTPAVLPYLYTGGAALVPNTDPSGEPLYFSVTLGAVERTTVTFNYATASGSAVAGVDFIPTSGTASIPAGKTSVIIVVTVLPNSPPSTSKTFTLTISNASGGSGLAISRPTGTGTILADKFSGATSCASTSVPLVGAYQGGATSPAGLAGVNPTSTCVMTGGVSGLHAATTWLAGSISGSRATLSGDVTGDGKTDLVGVNDSSVWVATSTGSGFSTPTQWSSGAFYGTVATLLADVNNDGKADLVAVNNSSVYVMLSNGVNAFSPPRLWSSATFYGSRATLLADVNGDHSADLVAISDSSTWVMLSNGVSGLSAPVLWSSSPFYGSRATLAADVNGDGRADLVAVSDNSVWVMRSTGTTFTAPASWSSTVFYGSLATLAGDLNGDGRVDLIAVNSNSVYAMLSNGSTAFVAPQVWATSSV